MNNPSMNDLYAPLPHPLVGVTAPSGMNASSYPSGTTESSLSGTLPRGTNARSMRAVVEETELEHRSRDDQAPRTEVAGEAVTEGSAFGTVWGSLPGLQVPQLSSVGEGSTFRSVWGSLPGLQVPQLSSAGEGNAFGIGWGSLSGQEWNQNASDDEKTGLIVGSRDDRRIGNDKIRDVGILLEECVKIRLPLLNKEMQFGERPERKRGKMDAASEAKNTRIRFLAMVGKEACDAVHDMIPEPKVPTKPELIVWARKYAVDIVANCMYSGVTIILAIVSAIQSALASAGRAAEALASATGNMGGKVFGSVENATGRRILDMAAILLVNASGHMDHASGSATARVLAGTDMPKADALRGGPEKAAKDMLPPEAQAIQGKVLEYWTILGGAMSSVLIITKNTNSIVSSFFEPIDKIGDVIVEALDVLKDEIEHGVTEILRETIDFAGQDAEAVEVKIKKMVSRLVGELTSVIDDVQKQLPEQLIHLLPWVARRKRRLVFVIAAPTLFGVILKCAVSFYHHIMKDVQVGGLSESERRLLEHSDFEDEIQSLILTITTLFMNCFIAALSGDSFVRFIINVSIQSIEMAANKLLVSVMKELVPPKKIQEILEEFDPPPPSSRVNMTDDTNSTATCILS